MKGLLSVQVRLSHEPSAFTAAQKDPDPKSPVRLVKVASSPLDLYHWADVDKDQSMSFGLF